MGDLKTMEKLLHETAFFQDFGEATITLLAGCATNIVFDAGADIARQGGDADRFYLVRHGDVALEIAIPHRDALIVETVHAGDVLGWSWLVAPYRWSFDLRALSLVRAFSFDAVCLRAKMEDDHEIGYQIMKRFMPVVAQRLFGARLQLSDLYGGGSR